jgi:hypothetical protein
MANTLLKSNKKLIEALEKDHQLREKLEKSGELFKGYNSEMRKCHEENAELLQNYISQYGWPFPSKFGNELHETAWFIAIHAISKPKLLKQVLNILENALKKGEKVAPEYAKLFDRIAIYEGRKQVYGTQFFPSKNGFYARDLLDPDNVDQRRTSLGLSKFEEGKKEVGAAEGGVITEKEEKTFEKDFMKFLKEAGWRT